MIPAASVTSGSSLGSGTGSSLDIRGLASSSPSSTGTDRGNAFQVLADGTQDLAALVGLFATDSVGRYAFDFSRGFLPVAMSTCSLLGLLGYCRALLKLAMGPHACEQSAFSTAALRPYMGVAARDRLPSEELTEVRYLERRKREGEVEWRVVKFLRHTDESMPLTVNRRRSELQPSRYSISELILRAEKDVMRTKLGFLWVPGSIAITTGATSFSILPFSGGLGWSRFYSTVGLFISILAGSLCWAWVYSQEQLPAGRSPWWSSRWGGLPPHAKSRPGMSLERKSNFAYYQHKRAFFMFNCRGVYGTQEKVFRIVSFVAAVSAAVSYVCQYIELRRLTARSSGVWLAIQGLLALVRIMAWILQPPFQSFEADKASIVYKQGDQFVKSFTETELVIIWTALHIGDEQLLSSGISPPRLSVPNWLVISIDRCSLPEAFELARRMREGTAESWEIEACQKSPRWWDFPSGVFGFWLRLRCDHEFMTGPRKAGTLIPINDQLWAGASCRIIQDLSSNQLHLFPGISGIFSAHHAETDVLDSATMYTFSDNVEENVFSFVRLEERYPIGRQRFYRNDEEAESDGVKLSWSYTQPMTAVSKEMLAAIDVACKSRPINEITEIINRQIGILPTGAQV